MYLKLQQPRSGDIDHFDLGHKTITPGWSANLTLGLLPACPLHTQNPKPVSPDLERYGLFSLVILSVLLVFATVRARSCPSDC